MRNSKTRKVVLYVAIGLMIPTFIIAVFYKQEYPVLGPVLAICGLVLLAVVSFIDHRSKK